MRYLLISKIMTPFCLLLQMCKTANDMPRIGKKNESAYCSMVEYVDTTVSQQYCLFNVNRRFVFIARIESDSQSKGRYYCTYDMKHDTGTSRSTSGPSSMYPT